jgi:allantoate deiminase
VAHRLRWKCRSATEACFPKTLLGSSVVSGALRDPMLDLTDADGVTIRAALAAFGGDPEALAAEAYRPEATIAYLELHIEQGPVLERAGRPLGVVTAIAGQSRYRVTVKGDKPYFRPQH